MRKLKLPGIPLVRKLMNRSSRGSKTHFGTNKRDTNRTWEVEAIRTVRHKISRMPVDQIAHTLFVSRLQPLAAMLEDSGWRSPYKARHYFISLAMQTPVPKRPRILSIEGWISPAATVGKVIEAYALRLASSDQNAWLASRVFYDRVLNPRFIDVEQVQEICRKFFAQMSATENEIGLPLKIVMEVFDHFEKVIDQQLNDLQQGRGPPLNRGQDPLLHTAEALALRISELGVRFGRENLATLLKTFGLARKQRDDRLFFSDEVGHPTLTEEYPLIVSGDHVYVGDINALWLALYGRLLRASREEGWSKRRGEYVEDKTADILRRLFGDEAVHQHVWLKKAARSTMPSSSSMMRLSSWKPKGLLPFLRSPPITSDHLRSCYELAANPGPRQHLAKPI